MKHVNELYHDVLYGLKQRLFNTCLLGGLQDGCLTALTFVIRERALVAE